MAAGPKRRDRLGRASRGRDLSVNDRDGPAWLCVGDLGPSVQLPSEGFDNASVETGVRGGRLCLPANAVVRHS